MEAVRDGAEFTLKSPQTDGRRAARWMPAELFQKLVETRLPPANPTSFTTR